MHETKTRLIFLTRSMTPTALSEFRFQTSSLAYEVNLVRSMAEQLAVSVVHVGKETRRGACSDRPVEIDLPAGAVPFHFFGPIRLSRVAAFRRLIARIAGADQVAVITSGYYPEEMLALVAAKGSGVRVYSIVFDTHVQGNAEMYWPKRELANAWFRIGFAMLQWLDGIVVVNDAFIISRRLSISYHKTRIGNLYHDTPDRQGHVRPSGACRLLFAGTMNADNGVTLLLEFMAASSDRSIELTFFGYGELCDEVRRSIAGDPRIRYGGVLEDRELDSVIPRFDFLLCLRDPASEVGQYAFPSKLIKFMGSGVPVICNEFPGLDAAYQEHVLLMRDYSAGSLARVLASSRVNPGLAGLGESARQFITTSHSWSSISSQMTRYLFGNPDEPGMRRRSGA